MRNNCREFPWKVSSLRTIFKPDTTLKSHSVQPKDAVDLTKENFVTHSILWDFSKVTFLLNEPAKSMQGRRSTTNIFDPPVRSPLNFRARPQGWPSSTLDRGTNVHRWRFAIAWVSGFSFSWSRRRKQPTKKSLTQGCVLQSSTSS